MSDQLICGRCRLPIHRDSPMQHFGHFVTHEPNECVRLLRAENGRLRQDAERYRWLTTRAGAFPALVRFIAANSGRVDTGFSTPGSVLQAQSISDAIDAARAHLEGRVSDE